MSNIPKDFNDLSIYSKAYILGKEIGKRARTEHYDFSQGFDLKTRDELIKTCRILNNHDIFGGTIYKLAMKSSLFKNIAENSKSILVANIHDRDRHTTAPVDHNDS